LYFWKVVWGVFNTEVVNGVEVFFFNYICLIVTVFVFEETLNFSFIFSVRAASILFSFREL
tara:strand:- start:1137 stop:1319 length:183 start_codon:yes stop_codon:yes gene_type:complete